MFVTELVIDPRSLQTQGFTLCVHVKVLEKIDVARSGLVRAGSEL